MPTVTLDVSGRLLLAELAAAREDPGLAPLIDALAAILELPGNS